MKAARFTSSQINGELAPGMSLERGIEETFTEGLPEEDLDTQRLLTDGVFI